MKLKPCPFCGEKAYFYNQEHNRIMHEKDCYLKNDTILNINDKNKTWNKRVNNEETEEDGVCHYCNGIGCIKCSAQPNQKYCKCPKPKEDMSNKIHPNHCVHCGFPIETPPKPQEEIEELELYKHLNMGDTYNTIRNIILIEKKINQLIRK